jgi:hypothetical protein
VAIPVGGGDDSYGTVDHTSSAATLNAVHGGTAIYVAYTRSSAYAPASDQGALVTLLAASAQ